MNRRDFSCFAWVSAIFGLIFLGRSQGEDKPKKEPHAWVVLAHWATDNNSNHTTANYYDTNKTYYWNENQKSVSAKEYAELQTECLRNANPVFSWMEAKEIEIFPVYRD